MKKYLGIIILAVGLCSFTAGRLYSVTGSIDEWQNVLTVIDQSDAPARQRNAARDMIVSQVNMQLTDTTKTK